MRVRILGGAVVAALVAVQPARAIEINICGAASSYMTTVSVGTMFFGRTTAALPFSSANNNATCARAAFLAATGLTVGVESFESSAVGDPFALSFTGSGVTGSLGGVGNDGKVLNYENYSAKPTDGTRYYYDDGAYQVKLDQDVRGFGFYTIGQGTYGGTSLTVSFLNTVMGGGNFDYMLGAGAVDGNVAFVGLILNGSNTMSQINFASTGSDYPGYDQLTVLAADRGQASLLALPSDVNPEPATMTLLASGLVGLAVAGRKKRRQ